MVDSFEARFQKAVKESSLPAKPDMQKIEELLVAINKSYEAVKKSVVRLYFN